ncbi:hypothetical protein [Emticicia sp. W12TSBA100-4]|uniref:hypothetical protein n=1 Tax=Emticicia sp. W12TSBA100-4 TaxID=3160965 RepID=UPI003305A298
MIIALIVILLCIMLDVMVYVIGSLVSLILKKHKYYLEQIKDERKFHKAELALLRNAMTNDFLMKAELLEMNKDPKIAIPLSKVDVVKIPIENPLVMRAYFRDLRPDSVSFYERTLRGETLEGSLQVSPTVLRQPKSKEHFYSAVADKVAEFLIKHRLIEWAIDERNMVINFRINVLE